MNTSVKRNNEGWVGITTLLLSFFVSLTLTFSNIVPSVLSAWLCVTVWTCFCSAYHSSESSWTKKRIIVVPLRALWDITADLFWRKDPGPSKTAAEKFCAYFFLLAGYCLINFFLNKAGLDWFKLFYLLAFVPPLIYIFRIKEISNLHRVILFLEFFGFEVSKYLFRCTRFFRLFHRRRTNRLSLKKAYGTLKKVFMTHGRSRENRSSSTIRKRQTSKKSAAPDPGEHANNDAQDSYVANELGGCASLYIKGACHE